MTLGPEHRLATYGSLAPGRINHHQLDGIEGIWCEGVVTGILVRMGWGADLGYPAIMLEDVDETVDVWIFEAASLPNHWARLDAFEGAQYERVITQALTDQGRLSVSIYAIRER